LTTVAAGSHDRRLRNNEASTKPAQQFEPVADIAGLRLLADGRPGALSAALAATEARYVAVLSNAAQAVWTIDPRSGAVVSGAGWQALTGQRTPDMLGFGWMAVVCADDRERVADICRGVLSSAAPRECEFRVQPSEGECRVLHFKLIAVHAADRGIQEWIGISTDITDRVRARQEDVRTGEFASRLVESTHDCVKVLDLEGRLVYVNSHGQALLRKCGFTTFMNRSWIDLWQEPWRELAVLAIGRAKAGKRGSFQGYCQTPDGMPKWWDNVITPIFAADGGVKELLAVSRDVSRHMEVLIELHKAQLKNREIRTELAHVRRITLLGTLAGSIAHELRQPLTAVMANARAARRFLERPVPAVVSAIEALDDIVRDDQRASQIIEHFRSLLKGARIPDTPCDLNDAVAEVVRLLRSDAAERQIGIRCTLDDGVPTVRADRVQLQQVVLNLVMNAFDAVLDPQAVERTVSIRTAREADGAAIVTVEDEGPPLSDDQFGRMQKPFYTTKPEGLGLGLAICREILAAHSSELRAGRKDTGGLMLSFRLPPHPE
jgi:PAS domain S-box-containing protein